MLTVQDIFGKELVKTDIKNTFPSHTKLGCKEQKEVTLYVGVRFLEKKGLSNIFTYLSVNQDKSEFDLEAVKESILPKINETDIRSWIKFNVSSRLSKQEELFDLVFSFGIKDQPVYLIEKYQ